MQCCHEVENCVILHVHMSVITQNGYSALKCAALEGHTEVVVELVKAKGNLDLHDLVCSKLHVPYVHVCIYMYRYIVTVTIHCAILKGIVSRYKGYF